MSLFKCEECGNEYKSIVGQAPCFYCGKCIDKSNDRVDKLKIKYNIKPIKVQPIRRAN